MKTNNSSCNILITGFGPFPGIAKNCSSDLAVAVCDRLNEQSLARRHSTNCATANRLSVEWLTVSDQLRHLYEQHRPTVAIHFGVCSTVYGLVVERKAHNACTSDPDARGCRPATSALDLGGLDVLETRLPVADIIAQSKPGAVDISLSDDAGRYLCNAAYYVSLSLAARQRPPGDALFVHLPASLHKDETAWPAYVDAASHLILSAVRHRQHYAR